MRVWNLGTLSELEPTVVGTFRERPASRSRISGSSRLKASFNVAAAAIAVSAALALPFPRISTTSLSLMAEQGGLIQSVARIAPPLAGVFAGRFGESWSAEQEQRALEAMAATRNSSLEYDEQELLDVALANQQESLGGDVPRLTPDSVVKILRKRSL